jgi:hypothetical protein
LGPFPAPRFVPPASPSRLLPISLGEVFLPHLFPGLFSPIPSAICSSQGKMILFEDGDGDFVVFISIFSFNVNCPVPDFPLWCSFFDFISFDFDAFQFFQSPLFDSFFYFAMIISFVFQGLFVVS